MTINKPIGGDKTQRIWAYQENEFDRDLGTGVWGVRRHRKSAVEYIRADIAEAEKQAAVMAEMERLAKFAESFNSHGQFIADAIRKGDAP